MKDKILKEVQAWYDLNVDKDEVFFEEFVDIVINKTAEVLFEEIKGSWFAVPFILLQSLNGMKQ